jgi:hypothetical protein
VGNKAEKKYILEAGENANVVSRSSSPNPPVENYLGNVRNDFNLSTQVNFPFKCCLLQCPGAKEAIHHVAGCPACAVRAEEAPNLAASPLFTRSLYTQIESASIHPQSILACANLCSKSLK